MAPDQEFKRNFNKLFAPIDARKRREIELSKKVAEMPAMRKATAISEQLADIRNRLRFLETQAAAGPASPPSSTRH